jgi:glycosyltransferase involved in cell wall biosynthesis
VPPPGSRTERSGDRGASKLVIQIPCFNEEETLGATLAALPRSLPEFAVVEWLVIDDGSTDATVDVAVRHGVDHVVRLPRHRGLARAFAAGLEASVAAGADVIVNLDGDNQYRADDIPVLVAPILAGRAEIVVGARPIAAMPRFSLAKRLLQRLGSWVVRFASRTDVPDAPSGFRAFSRAAAQRVQVFSDFTYTLETIIQAGQKGMAITSVPIRVNETSRPSRLMRGTSDYVRRSIVTILRIFVTYRPFHFFAIPGVLTFALGFVLGLRFLFYYARGDGQGHVQSLILAALLLGGGFLMVVIGLVSDLIAVNRKLIEKLDWRLSKLEDRLP